MIRRLILEGISMAYFIAIGVAAGYILWGQPVVCP